MSEPESSAIFNKYPRISARTITRWSSLRGLVAGDRGAGQARATAGHAGNRNPGDRGGASRPAGRVGENGRRPAGLRHRGGRAGHRDHHGRHRRPGRRDRRKGRGRPGGHVPGHSACRTGSWARWRCGWSSSARPSWRYFRTIATVDPRVRQRRCRRRSAIDQARRGVGSEFRPTRKQLDELFQGRPKRLNRCIWRHSDPLSRNRERLATMAGHGGGAWKVAYADFVTAMMAFFLVMWITAQSKPVKQAIAKYFNDPYGGTSSIASGKSGSAVAEHGRRARPPLKGRPRAGPRPRTDDRVRLSERSETPTSPANRASSIRDAWRRTFEPWGRCSFFRNMRPISTRRRRTNDGIVAAGGRQTEQNRNSRPCDRPALASQSTVCRCLGAVLRAVHGDHAIPQ